MSHPSATTRNAPASDTPAVLLTLVGTLGLGALGWAALASAPRSRADSAVRAARRLNRAAGTLAACVLSDSAVEHYRGSFHNKAMWAPLASATLSLLASAHGARDPKAKAHRYRDGIYRVAIGAGLIGTAFHLYNIGKRTGGVSWQNLFYAAPIGAPAALSLSGLLGAAAERVRADSDLLGLPAGRALATLASVGLAGSAAEAGLLHLRGAYHNPAMWLPVSLPPVAAALLAASAISPSGGIRRQGRWWLRLTAALGCVGAAFHIFGVSRGMGGWRNWTQNLLNGPPIPAPPSFTGLALAGLAALDLQDEARHGR